MRSDQCWTYFIKDVTSGLVKIGRCTGGVHKRLRTMECDNPNPMTIIGIVRGNYEKICHSRFAHLRRKREWFECTEEVLALVDSWGEKVPPPPPDVTECCTVCRRKAVIGTGLCRSCKPVPAAA